MELAVVAVRLHHKEGAEIPLANTTTLPRKRMVKGEEEEGKERGGGGEQDVAYSSGSCQSYCSHPQAAGECADVR